MNSKIAKRLLALGLLATPLLPVAAEELAPDQILRQMSDKLAAAHNYSFEATREIDSALIEGSEIQEKAHINASVQRPNKIAVQATSDAGVRHMIADGTTLSLLDGKSNCYATLPMPATLDELVKQLEEKYGFTPPLAEFALSNPYKDFHQEADSVSYLGLEKTKDGVECHRLALKGKDADAELWVSTSDLLPRKLVATFHREGNPQVHVEFLAWNLNAQADEAHFTFTPPKDAEKIEMWTTEQMQAASKS